MNRLAALAAAMLLLAGCGGDGAATPTNVTGVVENISKRGDEVRRFSVRADGRTYVLDTPADVDYGFDLIHLEEHRTTGDPVRCTVERRGDRLVATSIVDA